MSRQFKNRKAVDPYGKDYSTIPDTIQWGDMMISKDATPETWEKYAGKIRAGEESPQPYRNSMRQRTDRELIERGLADDEAKLRYSYNSALQKKESSERLLRINTLEDARREFPNRHDDELRQILDTTNKTRKYLDADAKKYAARGGGFPTYEEWKIQAEAGEKEHQRRMQAQTQPLRSVPDKITYDRRGAGLTPQSFSGGVVNPNSAASSAKAQKDEQPLRDMQGNQIKLDDMYISGGLGKSAESKKESAAAKKKASQPASTKGAGQAGGSFRVINGQVRFFGSGADAASEVEAVKPAGMR